MGSTQNDAGVIYPAVVLGCRDQMLFVMSITVVSLIITVLAMLPTVSILFIYRCIYTQSNTIYSIELQSNSMDVDEQTEMFNVDLSTTDNLICSSYVPVT